MKSRKKLLEGSRIYAILDPAIAGDKPLKAVAKALKRSKVGVIQYRDKKSGPEKFLRNALMLKKIFQNSEKIFLVNDYINAAMTVGSDGVHIGQEDIPLKTAREILGRDKIIGVSCHSLRQAIRAQKEGADYIGLGPIFPTPTKPEYKPIGTKAIKEVRKRLRIPFFVIGDIREENIKEVSACGANRVAMGRGLIKAGNIGLCADYILKELKQ